MAAAVHGASRVTNSGVSTFWYSKPCCVKLQSAQKQRISLHKNTPLKNKNNETKQQQKLKNKQTCFRCFHKIILVISWWYEALWWLAVWTLHSRLGSSWNSLGTVTSLSPKVNTPNAQFNTYSASCSSLPSCLLLLFVLTLVSHRFLGVMVTDQLCMSTCKYPCHYEASFTRMSLWWSLSTQSVPPASREFPWKVQASDVASLIQAKKLSKCLGGPGTCFPRQVWKPAANLHRLEYLIVQCIC